jgi:hypothetical protein
MTYCEASTCAFEPDAAVLAIDCHSELPDYFISNVSERYSFHKADLGIVDRELAELGHIIQRRHPNL